MIRPLAQLFQESVEDVRSREQTALEGLLDQCGRRIVLFGAGTLGRRALPLLREIGCEVVAFTDNNAAAWGTKIDEIPVRSPEDAASLHGKTALFLVTIWNDHHWFSETLGKLTSLGCTRVSTYAPLYWRFPDRFLQLLLLNEPPHRVYEDARSVLQAEKLWSDEDSLHAYRANIRWRALGDASELPGRPAKNTYFPDDLFHLQKTDSFLDCGAFDGDTIRELLACTDSAIQAIHAVEADTISFVRLQEFVDSLEVNIRNRISLQKGALGSQRGFVHFESNGTLISRASETGSLVEVLAIDDIFADVPLTLIKMDIEGAEYEALIGGAKVIRRDRPILAICVYHTQSDIWRIPLLVHEIVPEHKLYLRAYEGDGFQTVMYAVPSERQRAFVSQLTG
jgi:FkbM family methyltransferase